MHFYSIKKFCYLYKHIFFNSFAILFFLIIFIICPIFGYSQERINSDSEESNINQQKNRTETDKNKSDKKMISIAAFPFILYQPETSVIMGGGSSVTINNQREKDNSRPDNINSFALYTLKNQAVIKISPDFYFDDYNWNFKALLYYQKYPDTFYGIGNNTSKNNAEDYTTEDIIIQPCLTRRVFNNFRIGILADFKKTNVLEIESTGQLSQGNLKGVSGSLLIGICPVLDWDSRNNIFYPSDGQWIQFHSTFYRKWLNSDFDYEKYTFNFRNYHGLSQNHIIALQVLSTFIYGDIPFSEFAKLNYLRGINGSRFRESKMLFTRIEYRYPIYKRFSGVLFSAVGNVMKHINELGLKNLKFSWGFGLRYMQNVKEKINLRFDLGISHMGISPYFQISEAF